MARAYKRTTVELKAIQELTVLGNLIDGPEPVASIRVRAPFDIQQLFANLCQQQTFFTRIAPT